MGASHGPGAMMHAGMSRSGVRLGMGGTVGGLGQGTGGSNLLFGGGSGGGRSNMDDAAWFRA